LGPIRTKKQPLTLDQKKREKGDSRKDQSFDPCCPLMKRTGTIEKQSYLRAKKKRKRARMSASCGPEKKMTPACHWGERGVHKLRPLQFPVIIGKKKKEKRKIKQSEPVSNKKKKKKGMIIMRPRKKNTHRPISQKREEERDRTRKYN